MPHIPTLQAASLRRRRRRSSTSAILTALVTIALIAAGLVVLLDTRAAAQVTVPGTVDPQTAGVYLFSAGDSGPIAGECTGTAASQPTDEIINQAVLADALSFIGDVDPEIINFQPGTNDEMADGVVDSTRADVVEGLTEVDDFGDIGNAGDDAANADIGRGGSLELQLATGLVIVADGVVASGSLQTGPNATENLGGFEIFLFEDAELSGMQVALTGPTQTLVFNIDDYQVNPSTTGGADDTLLAVDLDSLAGWTDPYVISLRFVDDGVSQAAEANCDVPFLIDTSVEIDAVAARSDVLVLTPSVDIQKLTNGQDADTLPGVPVLADEVVTWTYIVTNNGQQDLSQVAVTDDREGEITCPQTELAVGAQMTCTATGVAALGSYSNVGTVVATPETGTELTASDPSNYTVASAPAVQLVLFVNGDDANDPPGPSVETGNLARYRYEVTNTGNGPLTNIEVTDDDGRVICSLPAEESGETELIVGDTGICFANVAVEFGLNTTVGRVVAIGVEGETVTDTDPANVTGTVDSGLTIQKFVNGLDADAAPGPTILPGEQVQFSYQITNAGNVTLTNVEVTDDVEGDVCSTASIGAGETLSCELQAVAIDGQYVNVGTVQALDPVGQLLEATDLGHYAGQTTGLGLEKLTNGIDADEPPGPQILAGETVTWTYIVTNLGNIDVQNVIVTDDMEGEICQISTIAPGETESCTQTGVAQARQYGNLATAIGQASNGTVVSASDRSHYQGQSANLSLNKTTNGVDADAAPGPAIRVGETVTWEYTATNLGTSDLSAVAITDDLLGPVCTENLPAGESVTCSLVGIASADQYTNVGTVTAIDAAGGELFATDASNYFGVTGGITVEKTTNGVDSDAGPGVILSVGDPVTWVYSITNTSNAAIASVGLVDDQEGDICSFVSLGAGQSRVCRQNGTATSGAYENRATVTAVDASGGDLSATDASFYFGAMPAISLEKTTNGESASASAESGPQLGVGVPVTWEYTVTNEGNVDISNVVVADNEEGEICAIGTLPVGASESCTATAAAVAGQYENFGTVNGESPDGTSVSARDRSAYFGSGPGMEIEKTTNGQSVSVAPGPLVAVGGPIGWDYTLTNTGNVALFDATVVDDQEGEICVVEELAVGEEFVCTASGVAIEGQYINEVVASATDATNGRVESRDTSGYFGVNSGLQLEKLVNDEDADQAPGPTVPVGDPTTFTFEVTNTGNDVLQGLLVSDDVFGEVCEIAELANGQSTTCTIEAVAEAGPHVNTAVVTGQNSLAVVLLARDTANYFGSGPGISVETLTNGEDSDLPPGEFLATGSPVTFTYEVTNTGNVDLANVVVIDSILGEVCQLETLSAGAEDTCTADGEAVVAGLYSNVGSATGNAGTVQVSDEDPTNHTGVVGALGDFVWVDLDLNGLQDEGEPGVAGVEVKLLSGNIEVASTVTGENGQYVFADLAPAVQDYRVQFVVPGATFTTQQVDAGASADLDSDVDPASGITGIVTVPEGGSNLGVDAGLAPSGIGDQVWLDLNANGIQDPEDGETGVADVVVELFEAAAITDGVVSGDPAAFTTTDSDGRYFFDGLDPQVTWTVRFIADGRAFTTPNQEDNDGADSDADASSGLTGPIELMFGATNDQVDAGVLLPPVGAIGDQVYVDVNESGTFDDGDTGLVGVVLQLRNAEGELLSEIDTDADGLYIFPDLAAGSYEVAVDASTLPAGLLLVADLNGELDGRSSEDLEEGAESLDHDFGYVTLGSIGDFVWDDQDRDGRQGESEAGIDDVELVLWTVDAEGAPDEIEDRTTTADGGLYRFEGLDPRVDWVVQIVPASDQLLVDAAAGDDDSIDSDFDPASGFSRVVNLSDGQQVATVDAGLIPGPASVGDTVFQDSNQDGVQNADELGIPNITLTLWEVDEDGGLATALDTQVTDENGNYAFAEVDSDLRVVVQVTVPELWMLTAASVGDDATVDSDPNINSGVTGEILLSPEVSNLDIDVGILPRLPDLELVIAIDGVNVTDPGDLPVVTVGDELEWTYTVTNTGEWDLADVTVVDSELGEVCVIDLLPIGESESCTANADAVVGIQLTSATAEGQPVDRDGEPAAQLDLTAVAAVTADDDSGYEGTQILRQETTPTPTPTSTPVPTATPTAVPTSTPVPTATLVPTSTPVPVPLAVTGSNTTEPMVVAVSLLLAGAMLFLVARRKRHLSPDPQPAD